MMKKRNLTTRTRTKYYYVRNPNVQKGDYFVNFTLKLWREKSMRFAFFL